MIQPTAEYRHWKTTMVDSSLLELEIVLQMERRDRSCSFWVLALFHFRGVRLRPSTTLLVLCGGLKLPAVHSRATRRVMGEVRDAIGVQHLRDLIIIIPHFPDLSVENPFVLI